MTVLATHETSAPGGIVESEPVRAAALRFGKDDGFGVELRKRVDAYFVSTGLQPRDAGAMYLKTAVVLSVFAASYLALVFAATTWWQAVPLSVLLGLAMAAIGFNIQHDGGHSAFSRFEWVNRAGALSLEMIGASSYLWHWKHAIYHHMYPNIEGQDPDIELGVFGRLSPHHLRRGYHRWQHLYLWPLYGFMALKWHVFDDFRDVLLRKIGTHKVARPHGAYLVVFVLGKLVFVGLALVLPLGVHSVLPVLGCLFLAEFVLGLALSIVFQLAHVVESVAFPEASPSGHQNTSWAAHQVATSVDFSRHSRVVTWLLGGLNFQIEHHLFPRICHIHYPALAPLVERTCRDYGLQYRYHGSFAQGLASHYRWLREMGRA